MVRHTFLAALLYVAFVALVASQALVESRILIQQPVVLPGDDAEARRWHQLERKRAAIILARQERYRIIKQLEQETITLDEAIELFRPLNEYDPICLRVLRERHLDHSEEEILGYQLVVAARAQLRSDEEGREVFVRKLVARLEERFGSQALIRVSGFQPKAARRDDCICDEQ